MQEIAALEAQQAEAAAARPPVKVEAGDTAMRLLRKECQLRDILAAQVWNRSSSIFEVGILCLLIIQSVSITS